MTNNTPYIDLLIATYNEEKNIEECLSAVLNQTYTISKIKIYIIDGGSTDQTIEIINRIANFNKNIIILSNPDKFQAFAWNKAIRLSNSPYISIISAHSIIAPDYIKNAIEILQNDEIALTGGHMVAKGNGNVSSAIAKLHHSKFGLGVSKFHDVSYEGFVDTVYTFNFRRETLTKNGLFNTLLLRNQDIELAGRIRKNGGKIFLSSSLDAIYVPRNNIVSFVKQFFNNSKFLFDTLSFTKSALSIRHFIPLMYILFILISFLFIVIYNVPFMTYFLFAIWGIYFNIIFFFSVKLSDSIIQFIILFFLHPLLHVVYGVGTLVGGLQMCFRKIKQL